MAPTSSSRRFAYLLQQLFNVGVFDFEDLELRRHLLQVVAVWLIPLSQVTATMGWAKIWRAAEYG
jgi:hypothetical protein